jgi:hypothetical protein
MESGKVAKSPAKAVSKTREKSRTKASVSPARTEKGAKSPEGGKLKAKKKKKKGAKKKKVITIVHEQAPPQI